jgi:hypothetical protein
MSVSLEKSLNAVTPHLPDILISEQTLSSIKSIAGIFPDSCCTLFGFEARLGDDVAECDFGVMIPRDDDRSIPDTCGRDFNLSEEALETSEWKQVLGFLSEWAEPGSDLHDLIGAIWLEFDLEQSMRGVPLPGLFFSRPMEAWPNHTVSQIVRTGVETLEGSPLGDSVERNLSLCIDHLPDTAFVTNVGVMLPRPYRPLKLHVGGLDPAGIIQYLSCIGWEVPHETVQTFLTEASGFFRLFVLSLELGDTINKSIGIECYYSQRKSYLDYLKGSYWRLMISYLLYSREKGLIEYMVDIRWGQFLDFLVEKGLCLESNRDAILAWPGSISKTSVTSADIESRIRRDINHVKITFSPEGNLSAKAYIMAGKQAS